MKKRFLTGLLLASMSLTMISCGKSDEVKPIGKSEDTKASEYVTLGEYKGIEVTLDGDYVVDDKAVDDYIDQLISYYGIYDKSDETVVKEDSVVNVDYIGYQDNQPFESGTAKDRVVDIANSSYIPGFAESLVGHEVGETFRADVTFPEEYGVESLNGQTVQFEFTIHYICKNVTAATLTDEMVKDNFQLDSVSALKEDSKNYLVQSAEAQKNSDARSSIMTKLVESSTVTLPEDEVSKRVDEYVEKYKEAYVPEGKDLEDYLKEYYNITYDEFVDEQKKGVEDDLTLELICQAIADQEGITIDEADYSSYVEYFLQNSNYEDEAALYRTYGKDEESGKEYFRKMFLCNQALDFVVNNAVINTK